MKTNIRLTLAYDGSEFLGWQKTLMGPSVEASLQAALEQVLQEPIVLQAASRTDAGVHAFGQVVNFLTVKLSPSRSTLEKLCLSLNALLSRSIVVLKAEQMPDQFHPTLDSISKEYHYSICQGPAQLPLHRLYSWHCPYSLDLLKMRQAALMLIGEHDFSSFCNVKKNAQYKDYLRLVSHLEIREVGEIGEVKEVREVGRVGKVGENRLRIEIEGNHFLYKMVRNIVGTLVYVGRGKLSVEEIPEILRSRDRRVAGMTAPAHGLTLFEVRY